MLRRDQEDLYRHLSGWDLRYAIPGGTLDSWHGRRLELPIHGIWARRRDGEAWFCEFLLNESEGDEWVYRRDPRVRLPLERMGVPTGSRLPLLAPEVVLLYKAKETRDKDEADFSAALPTISAEGRQWLAGALAVAHPGHPWAERLAH